MPCQSVSGAPRAPEEAFALSAGVVFVDTSALLALADQRDQYHEAARAVGRRHLASGGRFTGSVLVLAEAYTLILYRGGPDRARRFLDAVLEDAAYTWEPVTPELAARASADWLGRFADQRFSLTDAVSFTLMRARKIPTAFAFDDHFRTAGFALLH